MNHHVTRDMLGQVESLKDGIAALAQSGMPLKTAMAEIKRLYVEAALAHSQGMQTRAGRLIKAHRNTVSRIAQGKKRWVSTKS